MIFKLHSFYFYIYHALDFRLPYTPNHKEGHIVKRFLVLFILFFAVNCFAGDLPNPALTPGIARNDLTVKKICSTKWGKDHRYVTDAMKKEVFQLYGLTGNQDPFCQPGGCEIDHLISRELAGADDVKNLWPQTYTPNPETGCGARQKDHLENTLHNLVCSGKLPLEQAQIEIRSDWVSAFNHYVLGRQVGKYTTCK